MKALLVLPLILLGLGFSATPAPEPAAAPEGIEHYTVDGGHSSIVFKVQHFGLSNFYGRFNEVSGKIVVDPDDPTANEVEVEINAASIDTNSKGRDDHLKSADFFDVEQFPVILFHSTKVRPKGKDAMQLKGYLELHGVRKEIEAQLHHIGSGQDSRGRYRAGYEARFKIKRTDFGMGYGADKGVLGDEVEVIVALEATRDSE